jgi:hypothetical protein
LSVGDCNIGRTMTNAMHLNVIGMTIATMPVVAREHIGLFVVQNLG